MAEKEYIIPYSLDARKRHYHKTTKGKIERFVVQLEIEHEGVWREVIRRRITRHEYNGKEKY